MKNNDYKERFDKLKEITNDEEYLKEFIKLIGKTLYERDTFVSNSDNDSLRDEFYNNILRDNILNIYIFLRRLNEKDRIRCHCRQT